MLTRFRDDRVEDLEMLGLPILPWGRRNVPQEDRAFQEQTCARNDHSSLEMDAFRRGVLDSDGWDIRAGEDVREFGRSVAHAEACGGGESS